jgi:hypothetical protein
MVGDAPLSTTHDARARRDRIAISTCALRAQFPLHATNPRVPIVGVLQQGHDSVTFPKWCGAIEAGEGSSGVRGPGVDRPCAQIHVAIGP